MVGGLGILGLAGIIWLNWYANKEIEEANKEYERMNKRGFFNK
jgi:hypothetical protein